MDDIDRQILTLLAQDARASLKTLSAQVGLSSPSTSERLRRLEESGVIQGYTLNVNLQAVGYAFESLVRQHLQRHWPGEGVKNVSVNVSIVVSHSKFETSLKPGYT